MTSWTRSEVESARRVLNRRFHASEALPEISNVLGRPVKIGSLKKAFIRFGLGPVSNHVVRRVRDELGVTYEPAKAVTVTISDPLERREQKQAESRLKREHAELLERLAESEKRNKFADKISTAWSLSASLPEREKGSGQREGALVVLASDWHVEENVDPEAVAGRNDYNLEIANHRAGRFFDGVEWLTEYHRQTFAVRDLILWLGGDLITGYIHEELEEDNNLSPIEATLHVKGLLTSGIRRLLKDPKTERVLVPCNHGNHGRVHKKRRIKTGAQNSFEWMLYHVLAEHFESEPRVQFLIPRGAHTYVEAYGWNLHFTHGDEVNYWGGVGGLSIPVNKRIPKWDLVKPADYHHLGHFHTLLDLGHTVVNGSLIGYTDFAMSAGCDFEPPQQASYMLDSKRGKCFVTPIWVDEDCPIKRAA